MLKDWLKKVNPAWVSALAVLIAGITWMLGRGFVSRSAALFALILALPALYRGIKGPVVDKFHTLPDRLRQACIDGFPYAVVTIGTLLALGPVALGQMPISQDHANHYFATHLLVQEMIPSGRFFGWTDSLGTGYPFGDTYHTSSYLLTGLLYLVSFGTVSLQTSYAFGIVLAWLIPVLAVTAWTRRIAGPGGAVVAGLAFALDMGSDREGGWIYAMFHGVWTQHVGAGIWVLALLALVRLTEKPTTRRLAVAASVAGISMWIHPMNSLTLLLGGVLLFVIYYLSTPRAATALEKQKTLLLVPALFIAGAIGLVWVIRMISAGDVVFAYVAYWQPLKVLMKHLLEGQFMDNQLAVVSVLGLIGMIQLAIAGGRFRAYTLVLPAVCILIGSMALILESDMGLAGGSLGIMQYRRFSVAAKPFWFAMSGVGVTVVAAMVKKELAAGVSFPPALKILLAAIAAPFLSAALTAAPEVLRSPVGMPLTLSRTKDAANLVELERALVAESKRCPQNECRAVYFEKPGHGGLYPVISMADAGFAWQSTMSLPANNFKWINPTVDFDLMAKRGVSVVISKWDLKHRRLKKIGQFGRHRLYRVKGAEAEHVVMEGPGEARVVSFEPEKRVIQIQNAAADSAIMLFQPPYRKWHAEQDGKLLEIEKRAVGDQIYSVIRNIKNGTVTLTYRDTAVENVMLVVGLLLLAACAVGLVLSPRTLPTVLTGPSLNRVFHIFGIGASALLVLAPIGMLIGGKTAARIEWLAREPSGTVLKEVLHQRAPDNLQLTPERYCVPAYVRNPEFGCNERDMMPYLTAGAKRRGKIPSCLSIGVPPKGESAVTYELPSGTTHLKGRLHTLSGDPAMGRVGGQFIGKASRNGNPFEIPVAPGRETVTVELSSEKASEVCLELVAIERP